MQTRAIQFYYASAGGTVEKAVTITFQRNGVLRGISSFISCLASSTMGSDALNEIEFSFSAAQQFLGNDALGPIFGHGMVASVETSVGGLNQSSQANSPVLSIPVRVGDRLYIHTKNGAGVNAEYRGWLYVDE